jgi:AcrR family transcriptional regulator
MTDTSPDASSRPHASGGRPPEPVRGVRARRRAAVEADILRVGREHLATRGAAALSLRAVARDLGMVSSGIYRYVDSRDELLTRLIIDAYTSLADAVRARHATVAASDLAGRWDAIGHALRDWALDHPHDFALLYGSPVPDYEAPAERTTEVGTAVIGLLLELLADVRRAGRLAPAPTDLPPAALGALEAWFADDFFAGTPLSPADLGQGVAAWTLLLGAVTSEVFQQLGPLPDPAGLFELLLGNARHLVMMPAR